MYAVQAVSLQIPPNSARRENDAGSRCCVATHVDRLQTVSCALHAPLISADGAQSLSTEQNTGPAREGIEFMPSSLPEANHCPHAAWSLVMRYCQLVLMCPCRTAWKWQHGLQCAHCIAATLHVCVSLQVTGDYKHTQQRCSREMLLRAGKRRLRRRSRKRSRACRTAPTYAASCSTVRTPPHHRYPASKSGLN